MKQLIIKSLFPFFLLSSSLYAIDWSDSDFSMGITSFSSEAVELVYNPNDLSYKLSELTWTIDNAPLLALNYKLHLKDEASFSVYYKRNINTTMGVMDDYDWFYVGMDWTHWSHHENTEVTNIDIYGFTYESKKIHKNYSFTLGYEVERKKWVAYDGSFIYSDTNNSGFRDQVFTLTGTGPGITYIQELTTPYIALNADYEYEDLDIRVKLLYSPLASAKDYDTHHQRDIQFDSSFSGITFFGLSLEANYVFSDDSYFKASYKYLSLQEKQGITSNTDLVTGITQTYPGAGISNTSNYLELVYGWNL